jgi:hypothetical protein
MVNLHAAIKVLTQLGFQHLNVCHAIRQVRANPVHGKHMVIKNPKAADLVE